MGIIGRVTAADKTHDRKINHVVAHKYNLLIFKTQFTLKFVVSLEFVQATRDDTINT
ncbi:hypothetical protein D3C84_1088950 [compost metagenome]